MHDPSSFGTAVARTLQWAVLVLGLLLAGPLLTLAFGRVSVGGDWRTASHRPSGIAPDPQVVREAVVQVYAARTFGWRGAFADHTWLAAKPRDAERYTRYDVIGWYAGSGRSVVSVSHQRAPDAEWYGAAPRLLRDLRGPRAEAVIAKLPAAVDAYPFPHNYSAWPGPNSNTFIAYLGRAIPELELTLPSIAIGRDYLPIDHPLARTPSGTGWQVSLAGLLGATLARDEGVELNVLGLVVGFDWRRPAVKVPGIGRVPGDL